MSRDEATIAIPGSAPELRLALAPADLARLPELGPLRGLGGRSAHRARVHTVYFDTDAFSLYEAGLCLGIHRVDGRRVQFAGWRDIGIAGLFEPARIESPVGGDTPRIESIAAPALRAKVREILGNQSLEPLVETRELRMRRRIETSESVIDADLCHGDVGTVQGHETRCELILRLLAGERGDLHRLALSLLSETPMQIVTSDPLERGARMITGRAAVPRRARHPDLAGNPALAVAVVDILECALDQITANTEPAIDGVDPEGVHQLRVGVRRFRSALSLFKKVIPRDPSGRLRDELQWLGSILGPARDLDVFLEETLANVLRSIPDDPGLKRLREIAVERREQAYAQVRAALDSRRYTELVLTLGEWLARGVWSEHDTSESAAQRFEPAREAATRLLKRRHRSVRRHADALTRPPSDELHVMRIEVKKLRYAVEFLSTLYGQPAKGTYGRRLGRLQDALGHLTDQITTDRLLAGLLGEETRPELHFAAGRVSGWTARASEEGLLRMNDLWKRIRDTRPTWKWEPEE